MVHKRKTDDEIHILIDSFKIEKQKAKVAHEWAAFHILQSYIDLLEWTLGEKEINVQNCDQPCSDCPPHCNRKLVKKDGKWGCPN